VTGQLLKGGRPLALDPMTGLLQLAFVPVTADPSQPADPQFAVVDAAMGKFRVPGADGNGLAPGKYRVAVRQYDPVPTDKLEDKFDERNSPIIVEVTGPKDFPIDLDDHK
jgi:hypothetical protein